MWEVSRDVPRVKHLSAGQETGLQHARVNTHTHTHTVVSVVICVSLFGVLKAGSTTRAC